MGTIIAIVLAIIFSFLLFDILKSVLTGVCVVCEYFKNHYHSTAS